MGTYLLGGLAVGFAVVIINGAAFFQLGTDGFYYASAGLLNPFALIYGSMLPPVAAGMLYYFLDRTAVGLWIYLLLTGVLSFLVVSWIQRADLAGYDPYAHEVRKMLVLMVSCCCAGLLLIPFLIKSKVFVGRFV